MYPHNWVYDNLHRRKSTAMQYTCGLWCSDDGRLNTYYFKLTNVKLILKNYNHKFIWDFAKKYQDFNVEFHVTIVSVNWCMWYNFNIPVLVVNTKTEINTCDAASVMSCCISNLHMVCKSMSFIVCVNHN